MMRPLFFLAALLFIFSISACNKDNNNNPNGHPNLDYSVSDLTGDTLFYGYDNKGELNVYESTIDSDYYTITGNLLRFIDYRKTEKRTIVDASFTLNSDGNIIAGHGNFSYSLASTYTSDYTYTYDNIGNLTHTTEVQSDGTVQEHEYVWINDDVISVNTITNGEIISTRTIDYDLSKEDKLEFNHGSFLMPMNRHLGNANQHLEMHESTVFPPSTMGIVYDFTYTLDIDGFPTLETIFVPANSSTQVITYHYK